MSTTLSSALAAPLVLAIRLYQRFISPLTGPSCRFYPSCSQYAVTALVRFGPFRGGWLAIRRLGRCNPWNPGGVDPVPRTWATRGDVRPEDFRPTGGPPEPDRTGEVDPTHDENAQHRGPTT